MLLTAYIHEFLSRHPHRSLPSHFLQTCFIHRSPLTMQALFTDAGSSHCLQFSDHNHNQKDIITRHSR
jgi:hypothetical protein